MIGILDTNVLIVANGQLSISDVDCELAAVQLIDRVRSQGAFGLDRTGLILTEYGRNLDRSKPLKAGAQLLIDLFNYQRVQHFDITEDATRGFVEFPADPALLDFDRSDKKFVAVALVAGATHELSVATDWDFWNHRVALASNQVNLNFICRHRFAMVHPDSSTP